MSKTARTFTVSLKPMWDDVDIIKLLRDLKGTATVWAVNHDKDKKYNQEENTTEPIDPHTHFLIDYETPRKISTIANLFNVDENFIEIVKSKKAMLRYLTHKDDDDKYKYDDDAVLTNDHTPYALTVLGDMMSNHEIAKGIIEGKALELMDIVSPQRIRTIQAIVQYDKTSSLHQEIKLLNDRFNEVHTILTDVRDVAVNYIEKSQNDANRAVEALLMIANALNKQLNKFQEPIRHTRIKR
jgi:hypothetical protein